jgi:hypothetical protein
MKITRRQLRQLIIEALEIHMTPEDLESMPPAGYYSGREYEEEGERLDESNGDWFGARYPIDDTESQRGKPEPSDVREIVAGLSRALKEPETVGGRPWPPTAKSLRELYPNLAEHMLNVMNYLASAGASDDPGDIAIQTPSAITE